MELVPTTWHLERESIESPKLVGLSLEELSAVVEPFGSGIVGPPIDE